MTRAHQLLAQLYGLILSAEMCDDCLPFEFAFDEHHLEKFKKLRQEIARELKPEHAQN